MLNIPPRRPPGQGIPGGMQAFNAMDMMRPPEMPNTMASPLRMALANMNQPQAYGSRQIGANPSAGIVGRGRRMY